jgi:hypothetical protein
VHVNLLGIRALLVHALNEQAKAFYLGRNRTTCASSSVRFTSRICAAGRSYLPISHPNDSPSSAALQPEESI